MLRIKVLSLHQCRLCSTDSITSAQLAISIPTKAVASPILSADDSVCQPCRYSGALQALQSFYESGLMLAGPQSATLAMRIPAPTQQLARARNGGCVSSSARDVTASPKLTDMCIIDHVN